ncbi:hypothetical protein [Streptomyces sp. NPDC051997]|uniref:hypothetical protein n=1 Tax=Streptomyces sp. NPDC051997 TaxID=3155611 RepID=UPI003417E239
MKLFGRGQSTRAYPAAGVSVTGDAGRFRRHKTNGARQAQAEADRWEERDRQRTGTSLWSWRNP